MAAMSNDANGTLRMLPNRNGTVRWILYFRVKGQKPMQVRCTTYNRPEDRPAVEKWADDVRRIRRERGAVKDAPETVSQWYARYYRWREAHGRAESIDDSRKRFEKWIAPVNGFGDKPITKVTREDIETIVTYLDDAVDDERIAWKTAANVWAEITGPFRFATTAKDKSLRVLESNPAEDVQGPDRGEKKTKPFLRPDEVVRLLSCEKIPAQRRHVYALAIYTACRQSELRALRVGDVDWAAMQIVVSKQRKNGIEKNRTKSGRARVVAIEPNLVPLLRILTTDRKPHERLLRMPEGCSTHSETLRTDLLRAGCKRDALHVAKNDPQRARMKFHNLRDTCGTHMAVRRDPPQDVQWRLGHSTPAMTERYIAEARYQAGPNFGAPLPPLPKCLIGGSDDVVIVDVIAADVPVEVEQYPVLTVGQPGLEPETNGLRVHCSTN